MIFINVTTSDGTLVPVATTAIEICRTADSGDRCLLGLTSGRDLELSPEYGPDPLLVTQRMASAVRELEQRNALRGRLAL